MGLLRTAAHMAVASSVHGKVQRRQQSRRCAAGSIPDDGMNGFAA